MSKQNEKLLTLDLLKSLTPFVNGHDIVTEAARELFLNCVMSQVSVHDTFFENVEKDDRCQDLNDNLFPFATFATAYVAQTIISSEDGYKFHSMLKKDSVVQALDECYESVGWKKVGFHLYAYLYPTLVSDCTSEVVFEDYITNDGPIWAKKLVDNMKAPEWTRQALLNLVRGRYNEEIYNRDMNDLFVKLHLLDPHLVLPAYQHLFENKALPEVRLELATRNYLGGELNTKLVEEQVITVINKASNPLNASMLSLDNIQLFYGIEVDDFILTECRTLGFWSGKRPDNRRLSTFKDRCTIS